MNPSSPSPLISKIISGGQTGVDRAALDVAISLGVPHGGWCPRGRLAEDGPIASVYQLEETESTEYPVRTERNVIDTDGTLIISRGALQGGTGLTRRMAQKHNKPFFLANLALPPAVDAIVGWARDNRVRSLNVAGPRESTSPGVYEAATQLLHSVIARLQQTVAEEAD